MRKRMFLVLAISLLSVPFIPVEAATSQGFEWGLEVDDRIDYRITYHQPSVTSDPQGVMDIYVVVVTLPTIPDPVVDIYDITLSHTHAEFFYANGTSIGMVQWAAVAIGNWSLLTEVFNAFPASGNVSQNTVDWTITSVQPYGDGTQTQEMRFSKFDGAMNYYRMLTLGEDSEIINHVRIVRSGYNPNLPLFPVDPMIVLGIGAGVAIIAIVAVVVVRRRHEVI